MIWILIAIAIVLVCGLGVLIGVFAWAEEAPLIGGVFLVVSFLVALFTLPLVDMQYDKDECARFAEATEREVRFERTAYFNYSCLVLTDDGWVGRDRIVKVDD